MTVLWQDEYNQNMKKKENSQNNVGYGDLIEYLDKRFTFVDREFIGVRGEFSSLKKDFRELQGAVDAYAKKADTYFQEMVMLSHKIDRHEKWLQSIANKVGVKLEY